MHLKASFPRLPASSAPRWYFANFLTPPDHSALSSHGISLSPHSFISVTTYNLYLTPSQVSYLLDSHLATLSEVEDKLVLADHSISDAHHLLVEVSPDFDPSAHSSSSLGLDFHHLSPIAYSVTSPDLHRAASYLQSLATVYTVTPAVDLTPMNHISVGYVQAHADRLLSDLSLPRPLHTVGLQGNGTVVTVIDTALDPTSTFFYDSEPIGPTHRKLLYIHAVPQPMRVSEHGTHVCGSLAGNSPDAEAARFNGMAPMARLAYMPLEMAHMVLPSLADGMRSWGSRISTNSWGTTGYVPTYAHTYDDWAARNFDLTIVFSNGNDRARDWSRLGGVSSVGSPASSKNVLSVGSLAQLAVANPPAERNYVLTVIDKDKLRGHSFFTAKRLPFSADPFTDNVTRIGSQYGLGKQCKIITKPNQFETARANAQQIRFVVTTVKIETSEATPFGVFWVTDPAFLVKNRTARIIAVAQEYRTGEQFLGSYSSMGPTATGVVKPDVSAPGELIFSARSSPVGPPNHDLRPLRLHCLSGTSMATPHVAGSLALIEQWLGDAHRLRTPTSMLMRALAATCAEALRPSQRAPDNENGYGVLHLTKYLPMLGADSAHRCVFANNESIAPNGHLVSPLAVAGRGREVRVTLAYLDMSSSVDSRIPLIADLDLVVVSPTGRIFRGNHYAGDHEEHFSTIERVILRPGEIEVGDYEVHVLATAPIPVPPIRFAVAAVGQLSTAAELRFARAVACLPCNAGVCNEQTKLCDCSAAGRVGQTCQISPVVLTKGSKAENVTVQLGPLGVLYISFRNRDRRNGSMLGIHIHSVQTPVAIRLFADPFMGLAPADYRHVIWENQSKIQTWEKLLPHFEVNVMLRNDFSEPRDYRIWVDHDTGWRVLSITLATVGGVAFTAGVVIGIVCYCHRRRAREKSSPIVMPE